jgi:hypothetical protein
MGEGSSEPKKIRDAGISFTADDMLGCVSGAIMEYLQAEERDSVSYMSEPAIAYTSAMVLTIQEG